MGVEPAAPDGSYFQPIPAIGGRNVLGRIPGRGDLARRAILLGAHFDHLGVLDGETYHGADDNAAALAAVLGVAQALVERGIDEGREIRICAFDAEEPPFFLDETMGSMRYVETHSPDEIDLMICLDLVGHALGPPHVSEQIRKSVFVLGAELGDGLPDLCSRVETDGVFLRRLGASVVPSLSDYHAFRVARVPFLFFSCGRWRHYHQPTDTPEKLDYEKLGAFTALLERTVRLASARPLTGGRYLEGGTAHLESLQTLHTLAKLAEPRVPVARALLLKLDPLLEKASGGKELSRLEIGLISYFVQRLEEALAGT